MQCRHLSKCLLLVLLAGMSRGLAADETTQSEPSGEDRKHASQAFWNGKREYESGNYEAAQRFFADAYALTRDPALLFNMAQAYRKAGRCEPALEHYERFVRDANDLVLIALAEKQIDELKATCPQSTVAPVSSSEAQANVPDRGPVTRSWANALPPRVPVPIQAPASAPAPAPPPAPNKTAIGISIATMATGLAAAGVAVGLGIWNHDRHERWQAQDAHLERGAAEGETDQQWLARQEENDQLGQSINRVNREVLVLGLTSGALVATSVALYFTSRPVDHTGGAAAHRHARPATLCVGPKSIDLVMSW